MRPEQKTLLTHVGCVFYAGVRPQIAALVGENSSFLTLSDYTPARRGVCGSQTQKQALLFRWDAPDDGSIPWPDRVTADSFVPRTAPASVASTISPRKIPKSVSR